MRLIGLYLGTKYEVCKWNSLRDMTSSLVFYTFLDKFDLDLWPWPEVKVIRTWVIECALLGCTLVLSIQSVGEIPSEIWPVLWFFTHFFGNFDLDLDLEGQGRRSRSNFPKMGKNQRTGHISKGYFTNKLDTWYQGTTHLVTCNDPNADDLDQRSSSNLPQNG